MRIENVRWLVICNERVCGANGRHATAIAQSFGRDCSRPPVESTMTTFSRYSVSNPLVRSLILSALFATAACGDAAEDVEASAQAEDAVGTGRDILRTGSAPTVLKLRDAPSAALSATEVCSLRPDSTVPMAGPARVTASGHLTFQVGASSASCPTFAGKVAFVFARHVRSTESSGIDRRGTAAAFREATVTASDGNVLRGLTCSTFRSQAKPMVVLLHPAGADSEATWTSSQVFRALDEAGYCPVALDLRGHGQSSKPYEPAAYDVERMKRDVVEWLDGIGVREAHFHGYSLGGALLIRLLPELAAAGRVRSAAFGGSGLPTGARDDTAALDRAAADAADARAKQSSATFSRDFVDAKAMNALFTKAPWTQPMAPVPLESFAFPMLGMFGDFDSPVQNTRTFAARSPRAYVGTVVFSDRLHVGTISAATMPSSYAPALVSFFTTKKVNNSMAQARVLSVAQLGGR
jgi:pimeloyl-ACP methyl ester carboxylesterase